MLLAIPLIAAALFALVEHGLRWHHRRLVSRLRPWDATVIRHVQDESRRIPR